MAQVTILSDFSIITIKLSEDFQIRQITYFVTEGSLNRSGKGQVTRKVIGGGGGGFFFCLHNFPPPHQIW